MPNTLFEQQHELRAAIADEKATGVTIPPGVYLLDEPLVVGPRMRYLGGHGVILRPSENFRGDALLRVVGEDLLKKRISEFSLVGMKFVGDDVVNGVNIQNTDHFTARDCVAFRCGVGIMAVDNWDILLDNWFSIVCGDGAHIAATDPKMVVNVLRIVSSTFERSTGTGLIIRNSNNVWLTDVKLHGIPMQPTRLALIDRCNGVRARNTLVSQIEGSERIVLTESCSDVKIKGSIERVLRG